MELGDSQYSLCLSCYMEPKTVTMKLCATRIPRAISEFDNQSSEHMKCAVHFLRFIRFKYNAISFDSNAPHFPKYWQIYFLFISKQNYVPFHSNNNLPISLSRGMLCLTSNLVAIRFETSALWNDLVQFSACTERKSGLWVRSDLKKSNTTTRI